MDEGVLADPHSWLGMQVYLWNYTLVLGPGPRPQYQSINTNRRTVTQGESKLSGAQGGWGHNSGVPRWRGKCS